MELLFKNVKILDGTGKKAYTGNVGVHQGKIRLWELPETADRVIEGNGRYLTPGFIDAHSHGDELVGGADFAALCKINQGITTQVIGQCGSSPAPTGPKSLVNYPVVPNEVTHKLVEMRKRGITWTEYVNFLRDVPKVPNIRPFIGFNAIRTAVMGNDDRAPTEAEIRAMQAHLIEAMEHGAAGMSTGIAYVPATYATTDEIAEVAKVMAPYGGIYTTHMRNESKGLIDSVKETLEIGRKAGVKVNISHFKVMGKDNWGNHKIAIDLIEKARAEGQDVTCDQYPYNASMTHYRPAIPHWHFTDGLEALVEKLKDPAFRELVKAEILDPNTDFENVSQNAGGWDGVTICLSPNVPEAEGLTFGQWAKKQNKDPFDAYFDLMIENKGIGTAVYHSMRDEDLFDIIQLPYVMVGTDGIVESRHGKCHPRGWAAMVHAIDLFCKKNPVLPLEELVRKMTSLPAERYGMPTKGRIAEGFDGDLVLMDYENLQDNATYQDPAQLAGGIDMVIVNGQVVYENGELTGTKPGKLV